jgi:mRNA deadenylase 3'-5' endonuclease subunit Ccr4
MIETHVAPLPFHFSRDACERAQQTLQRLSISLRRKVRQEERKIQNDECRKGNMSDKDYYAQFGANESRRETGANTTIWTQRVVGALLGSGEADETEVEPEGYSRFPLTDDISIAKLWDALTAFHSSKLCIEFSEENIESTAPNICLPLVPCPPTILSVRTFENFGASVFVGVPLVVRVETLHATLATVTWFVDGTVVCRDSEIYTPCCDDIGKSLSVLLVPVRPGHQGEGCEEAYEFSNKVEELPFMPLVSPLRDAWLGDDFPRKHLRVMTYNILADLYASREMDQAVMYNHCPVEYLCLYRRMPMLLYELLAFKPDIICLQEVDCNVYKSLFEPVLESKGYQGFYSNKACAQQQEGCAMFWSLRTFQRDPLVHQYYLKDLFHEKNNEQLELWESLHDIDRLFEDNCELGRITTEKVGQVLQLAELRLLSRSKNRPERILVGNTHLFYHPLADHIRTIQAYMVCRKMDFERRRNGRPCPLVFCGDLNSGPLSGAVQLLLQRTVGPENHDTWKHLHDYEWDMGGEDFLLKHGYIGNAIGSGDPLYEDEAFEDALQCLSDESDSECTRSTGSPPQIRLPPTFPSLVSGYPNIPEFTNFATDFSETLDYILVSEPSLDDRFGLLPYRAAPMPSAAFVKQFLAMPNENMPSDHVSLVCDLEWEHYKRRSLVTGARARSRNLTEKGGS